MEQVGTTDDSPITPNDIAYSNFQKTVQFEDGRYVVRWPWRDPAECLTDNYGLAFGRLCSLYKRLSSQPDVLEQYDTAILDQFSRNIIEPVDDLNPGVLVHYLPHHGVFKPGHQTTKLRVVYDASAKTSPNSSSLNECLLPGPNLLPDLCGILLRFRMSPIAVISDIEKAFLQVGLHPDDRDVTRFLWLKDISKPPSADNLQIFRFTRIPFGVVSSPFLLTATIRHHLTNEQPGEVEALAQNTYVDNVVMGLDTVDDALTYYASTKQVFNSASMNLREWASNSPEFLALLPEHDRSVPTTQKVLGLSWDTVTDELTNVPVDATSPTVQTKRHILQIISRFFDPLGLQSPVLVKAKILVQDMWKLGVGWDDVLPNSILQQWQTIALDIERASAITYPRFIGAPTAGSFYELNVFCDASQSAYGVAAYLTVVTDDRRTSNLIFSKSKVAPVKSQSIPRLELMAALLGARIVSFLRKELQCHFTSTFLWSDSTTVLHWLSPSCNTDRLPVFVKNRVFTIQSTPDIRLCYVASESNPADMPSRGVHTHTLNSSSLWWHGPAFLANPHTGHHPILAGEGPTESSSDVLVEQTGGGGLSQHLLTNKKKSDGHHGQNE